MVDELEHISIAENSQSLDEPFTMIDLVQIDDLSVSLYLCQGTMPQHRHLDQDELFLVYSGTMSLESEWGTVILRPGELTVVPKGLGHRSSSLLRSLVLLIQPRLMVNRRNGDRRLFALKAEGRLEKVSVSRVGSQIVQPYQPVVVADVDTFSLYVMLCRGTGPEMRSELQATMILCHEGSLVVDTDEGAVPMLSGELLIVPKGMVYQIDASAPSLALGVLRHAQPTLDQDR